VAPRVGTGGARVCEHAVEFYETDEFLVDTVSQMITSAMHDGGAAIILATPAHRRAFETAVHSSGTDVVTAMASDRYLAFDAAELLETFMVGGAPDAARFAETLGAVIERAAGNAGAVRIYDEMVALLLDGGDVASTIALEGLWNELEATHGFALLCAYPMRAFEDKASAAAFEQICGRHNAVIPAESYSLLEDLDQQRVEVARLQQQITTLRSDLAGLRARQEMIDEIAQVDALSGIVNRRAADLLETNERVAKLGSWEWIPDPDALLWSDNLFRIFGLEPREIAPTREFVVRQMHPVDRGRMARYFELTRQFADPPPIEYRIQLREGAVRYLRSTITKTEAGPQGAQRIFGVIQDVTDQRVASRELAAHVAVSAALIDWESFEVGAMRLLGDLGRACEFVVGALWLPHDDVLAAELIWSEPSVEIGEFETLTLTLRLRRGASLPGLAWESKQPQILLNAAEEPSVLRRVVLSRAGLRGAVAFPAMRAGEVLAVLEFYSFENAETERLGQTLTAIGSELGEFLSRRRGELSPLRLTRRELEILQLAALGNNAPQIAESLFIGVSTVKTHMEHIYLKLGVSGRAAAVARALRLGVIR
jgi:DNA-binding CsgD family transcriptional regulator/PAS domain-containing protein